MHDFGDFDPAPGHLEMRMILAEKLCRGFRTVSLHNRITTDPVLGVGSAFGVDSACLAQGRAAIDDGRPWSPIHFVHSSMPFFCCSGVDSFIIFSKSAALAMYKTMNFFIC
jgi:hypothetical protein